MDNEFKCGLTRCLIIPLYRWDLHLFYFIFYKLSASERKLCKLQYYRPPVVKVFYTCLRRFIKNVYSSIVDTFVFSYHKCKYISNMQYGNGTEISWDQ